MATSSKKIITPDQFVEQQDGRTVAVVAGSFDLLQPGNLKAVRTAALHADLVCVIVEPDESVSGHTGNGRPRHTVDERMECVAHLRDAALVIEGAPGSELFAQLAPYTFVHCKELRDADPCFEPAQAHADAVVEVGLVEGCSTEMILQSLRAGHTPISADIAPPVQAAEHARPLITVNGCFDILHIGHLRFLEQAAGQGRELVVLINDDESVRAYKGDKRPIFSLPLRSNALAMLETVAGVRPFSGDDPLELIKELRPEIHVKGGSYEADRVKQEKELVESWGGKLMTCEIVEGRSTSNTIEALMK